MIKACMNVYDNQSWKPRNYEKICTLKISNEKIISKFMIKHGIKVSLLF